MKHRISQTLLYILIIGTIVIYPNSSYGMTLEEYIAKYNPEKAQIIATAIYDSAERYNIDPLFMASVFFIESQYNNAAISSAGAQGIAQLMPSTASYLRINPNDIYQNIEGGTRYMREMIDNQNNNDPYRYNLALASYNAGLGNVHGTAPSYTWTYIQRIKDEYHYLIQIIDNNNAYHQKSAKKNKLTPKQKLYHALLTLKNKQEKQRNGITE